MTGLIWDINAAKRYELGVDRGVLYRHGQGGVAWNGLISVVEVPDGSELNEYYHDGIKYMEDVDNSGYQATMKAFSYPVEFEPCIGLKSIVKGFSIANQAKETFGLSYRTRIGDDGYKIHLIYNATATPSTSSRGTRAGNTVTPTSYEWKIDAVPPPSKLYKPTAHFFVDSTKVDPSALDLLEALLYGTNGAESYLPLPDVLINLFGS